MRAGLGPLPTVEFVADRRDAIGRALAAAKAGDCVVIAGKGHDERGIRRRGGAVRRPSGRPRDASSSGGASPHESRLRPADLAAWTDGRWTAAPAVPVAGFGIGARALRAGEAFVASARRTPRRP
jgi:hypothetical protein